MYSCLPSGEVMELIMSNSTKVVRIDTHRPCIMPRDACNGSYEEECGRQRVDQGVGQGRTQVKSIKPPKAERQRVARFWRVAGVFGIAVFAAMLLVHWGLQ